MNTNRQVGLLLAMLPLAACAYRPTDVADPETITLRTAVLDVVQSLEAGRQYMAGRPKSGLIVDEATVVFNVSAKSNETTGLKLEASAPPALGFPLKINPEYTLANEGNRGNQITLKFKNLATAKVEPKGTDLLKLCNGPNRPSWCPNVYTTPGSKPVTQ